MDAAEVTRFEVIDWRDKDDIDILNVHALTAYGVSVELSLQDDGRTLKVFLRNREDAEDTNQHVPI